MLKKILTIGRHILLWCIPLVIIFSQFDEFNKEDVLEVLYLFSILAALSYIHMYVLLYPLFFRKKYVLYGILFICFILLGGLLIQIILPQMTSGGGLPTFWNNVVSVTVILLITGGFSSAKELVIKQRKLKEIENKQLKTELSLLKSQINPHFLFNTLNNLYGLITAKKNDNAANVTLQLSDLMRYLLENSKQEKISIKKEIKFLEDYISLEKIRLRQDTKIEFGVAGLEQDLFVAPLLFIPLVENVFKHGFGVHNPNPYAHFLLSIQGNEIFFEAENSYSDEAESSSADSGTGIENLKKRLTIIYPDNHLLEIKKEKNFYIIKLNITL